QLYTQLRGKPCQPFNSDQRIAVKKFSLHTYPDVSVICGKLVLDAVDQQAATNPHSLFEVLSRSTESYDRGLKFEFYRSLPSLQEYILVALDRPAVDRFVRQESGQWLLFDYHGLESIIPLPGIGCELRLADIYEGVEFGEEKEDMPT
ncbi:MAG: Uma2 family endonuclease, partial [Planctomycetales bacterium]|nr:Uma2 family endonuclease [Planctomycetales bacterium]